MCAVIALNVLLYAATEHIEIPSLFGRQDASGLSHDKAQKFVYFFYHLGAFPLTTQQSELIDSEAGAQQSIIDHGEELMTEWKHWARYGEHARIWAYMPHAFVYKDRLKPSVKLFNAFIFLTGLLCCLLGFSKINRLFLGIGLVGIINLSPFFIYEIYSNENIFGLACSIFLILLGTHLFLWKNKSITSLHFIIIFIGATLCAVLSEMRNSFSVVLLSQLIFIACIPKLNWRGKFFLLIFGLCVFWGFRKTIAYYFKNKQVVTEQLVERHGGHVYSGHSTGGHGIWHPIFCGLGDFDKKYGYTWRDQTAYAYSIPHLQNLGYDFDYEDGLHTGTYYDGSKLFYRKFEEIPEYEAIIKNKVIMDIASDPLWYMLILLKRLIAICSFSLPIPFIGWFIIYLFYKFAREKNRFGIVLLLTSLPLSLNALLIYAGQGATFNGVFGYVVFAFLLESFWKKKGNARPG